MAISSMDPNGLTSSGLGPLEPQFPFLHLSHLAMERPQGYKQESSKAASSTRSRAMAFAQSLNKKPQPALPAQTANQQPR